MSLFQALVLGLVQGLTEFIPISSSGHLQVVPFIAGWDVPSVAFDVAVHLGTLAAVVWVFRAEIGALARAVLSWSSAGEDERAMIRFLVIGTIPAAVIGIVFNSVLEETFERPVLVSLMFGITGYLLISTETKIEQREGEPRTEQEIEGSDAWTIGAAQAVALLPGISRSGTTIAAGMRRGLSRRAAARFSFLLSIPAIAGATIVELPDMGEAGVGAGGFLIAIVAAGASGAVAIRWFLGVIERRGLRPFGAYCWMAMTAGLLTALARG